MILDLKKIDHSPLDPPLKALCNCWVFFTWWNCITENGLA